MQLLYAHTQHLRTKLVRSKKIARANIKFNTNTSYFSMLNQIANLQIRDFAKASSMRIEAFANGGLQIRLTNPGGK